MKKSTCVFTQVHQKCIGKLFLFAFIPNINTLINMKQNKNLRYALLLLISIIFTKMGVAQNSCSVPSTVTLGVPQTNKSQTASKYWYKFTATKPNVFLDFTRIDSTFFGVDSVIVYQNNCSSLTPIQTISKTTSDSLDFFEMYLEGLTVNNEYLVKVSKTTYSTVKYDLSFFVATADTCNLVNNSDLNSPSPCPNSTTPGTVQYLPGNAFVNGWVVNGNTADFFHTCASAASNVNPNIATGLIPVTPPAGYIGMHMGYPSGAPQEYATGSTQSMVAGKKYYISMEYAKRPGAKYSINHLGMSITNGITIYTGNGANGFVPTIPWQIQNYNNTMLNNTTFKIMGSCYQAAGGENRITIGNPNTIASSTYSLSNSAGSLFSAYYFVDNIKVTPLAIDVSPTDSICLGASSTLTMNIHCPLPTGVITNTAGAIRDTLVTWTPTVSLSATTGTSTVASPTATTIYTVTLVIPPMNSNGSSCTVTNTVLVVVSPNPTITISASPSKTVCAGNTVTLTAGGADVYSWNPGALSGSTVAVTPTANIVYTVVGTNSLTGCSNTQTIGLTVVPNITLTASASPSIICSGQSSTLTASGASTYTWMPGSITTASTIVTPTTTTIYTVTGSNGTCYNTQTVQVTVNTTPTLSITGTASLCAGSSTTLTASGASTYTWSPCTGTVSCNANPRVFSPTVTTVYTAIGTSSAGCVGSKTFTVTVAPTPTITVNSPTVCAGSCATLTANGANTYTWSAPISSTVNPAVVCPTVTTIYTVTGQNTGCPTTSVKTSTVTVISPLPGSFNINTASPVIANGTGTNVIGLTTTGITNTVGLTFNWSNGASTPTTNFNLTQPTVISLTITNNACGTSISNSICVNYVSASCAGTFPTLNNATLTGTATLGATTATYNVTGTLTINWPGPLALGNKTFIMATGSKVEITATSDVTFNNLKFYSCNGLWRGIEVKTSPTTSARLTISGDDNSIEDAYMGVYCVNPSGANLNPTISCDLGVLFNKNYYDVYLENTKNATVPYTFNFSKSRMYSQSTNNSPGGNLKCSGYYTPTVKSRSYAGLYATNAGIVNFNFGVFSPSDYNQVKNKDYGLYFNNTNSTVNNVNFSDAMGVANSYSQSFGPLPSGVGIYSKNSSYLNVKPATAPSPYASTTTFTNLGYSIITNNTYTVDVQNTNHTSSIQSFSVDPAIIQKPEWGSLTGVAGYGLNGVFVTNARDICRINTNTFSQNYYPVTVNYTVAPSAGVIMSVATNTISATGTGVVTEGTTINSALPFATTPDNMRVAANTYTNVQLGVKATSVNSGLRISNNKITLKSTGGRGVSLFNSNNVVVDANTIIGNNTASISNIGIFCENSGGCKIKCNNITNTGHGVEFRGNNSSSGDGFFGNTLTYPMKRGLVLTNGGIIGAQGNSSGASFNQWIGWPTTIAAADPNQTFVGGTPPGGAASNAVNSPLYVHNNATELPSDNYFAPPSNINSRYVLNISTFTTTAGNTSTCPNSLTQGLRTNGTLATVDNTDRDNDFVNYINNLVPAANTDLTPQDKFMLKQYMFEALSQNPSTNTTIANFYNQQQTGSINTYYDIDSLLAAGNMALANAKNNQASQTNDITQTQNAYNALYINGINNQTDMDNLLAIANLCPSLYGNAVFEARALLQSMTYVGKVYNDSCDNSISRKNYWYDDETSSVSLAGGVQAKLYPNPNNGMFMLAYDLKTRHEAAITIIDIAGKLVYTGSIDNLNNVIEINTSNLQSGIYFIQLVHDKTLLWTDKLMISK